jgi:glycosyltransferase involved in cell wall biosynthesis
MSHDFSVLIPAHGSCEYIEQTLKSICMSSVMPDEVIIVDDGVTSQAMVTILKFSSELVLAIHPNSGTGLVDALNTGIEKCKSTFIARLDADDVVTADRFSLQLDSMRLDPEIAVLGGQVQYIDASGLPLGKSNYFSGPLNELGAFKTECLIAHPSAMIRRGFLLDVGGYRSICRKGRTDIAEDFDLWLRISRVGKVCNLDSIILLYRQHANQLSANFTPEQLFSTLYVSLVNEASVASPFFEPRKLSLKHNSIEFLIDAYKSLAPFVDRKKLIVMTMEGSLVSMGISNGFLARAVRRLIRSIQKFR